MIDEFGTEDEGQYTCRVFDSRSGSVVYEDSAEVNMIGNKE